MGMAISGVSNGYAPSEHIVDQASLRIGNTNRSQEIAPAGKMTAQEIDAAVKDLERFTLAFNKKLRYSVNHETNDVTVKVIDPETDKVIKELPPKELQRLHSKLKEMIGVLFDTIV